MSSCIDLNGAVVAYGKLRAVQGVNLRVDTGELVFVAGPNGAGKSSLLRCIAGVVKAAAGTVKLFDQDTRALSPDGIVARGLTMVPEGREIFGTLSVEENLRLGAYLRRDKAAIEQDFEFVLSELPALRPRLRHAAGLLSGGQQQMLAVGRALMTQSKVMVIDEPSLGLAPKIVDQIYSVLMDLRAKRGLTLLIAEQSFARSVELNARLLMMRGGQFVREGLARDLATEGALEDDYFGEIEVRSC